jgi:hypothetical protein
VNVGSVEFLGSFARAHLLHDAFATEPLVAQFPQTMVRSQGITPGRPLRVRLPAERLRVFGREATHG